MIKLHYYANDETFLLHPEIIDRVSVNKVKRCTEVKTTGNWWTGYTVYWVRESPDEIYDLINRPQDVVGVGTQNTPPPSQFLGRLDGHNI